MFLLRWIRVLFSREFVLEEILIIWDELLADLSLVDFFCFAMMESVRSSLLCCDSDGPLALLLRFPPPVFDCSHWLFAIFLTLRFGFFFMSQADVRVLLHSFFDF